MNTSLRQWLTGLALASLCVLSLGARAQNTEATPPPPPPAPAVEAPLPADAAPTVESPNVETPAVEATDEAVPEDSQQGGSARSKWEAKWWGQRGWRGSADAVVSVGGDSKLEKGRHAESVVSVFGSSTSDGDVSDAVVSVFGDTRVTGTVADAAVAVFGDNYVNGKVFGDVVAVMGSVTLGPEAEVNGEVVVVGGDVVRDPKAVVHGGIQHVLGASFGSFHWLRPWIQHCLLYGRPLALASGLGWAWGLALGFLALYTLIAVLFRDAVDGCVKTLEERPGKVVVAALLGLLLTPVLFALLFVTIIGIAFTPFAAAALFMATVFGKVVVLAWIGRAVSRAANQGDGLHTAVTVVIGGAVMLVLYLVPVIGFIVYKALGILGFGVAVYAVIVGARARRAEAAPPPPSAAPLSGDPYIGPEPGGAAYAAGTDSSASFAGAADSTAAAFASTSADSGLGADPAAGPGSSAESTPAGAAGAGAVGAGASAASAAAAGAAGAGGFSGAATQNPAGVAAATSVAVPSTLPRADFMVRMGALLIDTILVAVVLHALHSSHESQLIVLAIYGAMMWKLKGTTIGGIVFGLQVVRADGRPIDWSTAIVRALSCFLSLMVVGLGFIWIAFDDQRQGWHDKIAGTLVVRVPKGVSLL